MQMTKYSMPNFQICIVSQLMNNFITVLQNNIEYSHFDVTRNKEKEEVEEMQ